MALATGPLNPDACLPTPTDIREAVFGASSAAIARQRARQRHYLLEVCSETHFWWAVVDEAFPELQAALEDELGPEDVLVTRVHAQDIRAANQAIDRVATAKIVFVPTHDD